MAPSSRDYQLLPTALHERLFPVHFELAQALGYDKPDPDRLQGVTNQFEEIFVEYPVEDVVGQSAGLGTVTRFIGSVMTTQLIEAGLKVRAIAQINELHFDNLCNGVMLIQRGWKEVDGRVIVVKAMENAEAAARTIVKVTTQIRNSNHLISANRGVR